MTVLSAPLEALLQRQRIWRGGNPTRSLRPALSTGFALLDRHLPGEGWPTAALIELLTSREGGGELQLLLPALAALSRAGRRIVWLAPPHLPFAPALAAAGVDLRSFALLRTPRRRDALWAAEQVLRAGACRMLIVWSRDARYAELRRLAVAAEASRVLAVLFRPQAAAQETSPAVLRIALEPVANGIDARILKCRGPRPEAVLRLPISRPVHALDRSAPSATRARDPVARACAA